MLPGAAETLGSFAELAVQRGVPRLVLLSGRGEDEAERAERAVRAAGAELTIVRSEVLDGRNAHLADGVQRALGREPRDFRDDARETAATGIWDPPAGRTARSPRRRPSDEPSPRCPSG